MNDLSDIKARVAAAKADLKAADDAYQNAIKTRGPGEGSAAQAEALSEAQSRFEQVSGEFKAAVRDGLAKGIVEAVSGDGARVERSASWTASYGKGSKRYTDPFVHGDRSIMAVESTELRDRATAALSDYESHQISNHAINGAARDRLDKALRAKDGDDTARLIVAAADPDYAEAFRKITVDSATGHREWTEAEAAAYRHTQEAVRASLQEGNTGASIVPFYLDPTVILTGSVLNDFRSFSRTEQINTNVWHGVSSAGAQGEWVGEATETSDASPTLAAITIPVYKADTYVAASLELIMDQPSWQDQVVAILADSARRLDQQAFATGTGVGQPTGIITRLDATTASRVAGSSNGNLVYSDIPNVAKALPARWQENASWVTNYTFAYDIRGFAANTAVNSSAFWAQLDAASPALLMGRPLHLVSGTAPSPVTQNTASYTDVLVYGDFGHFCVVDRVGMFVESVSPVLGSNRRPTGERGWVAWHRCGSDTTVNDAFRMLRVTG